MSASLERSRSRGIVVVFWSWSACALHSCAVPSATVGFVIRYPEFGYCSCNYNGYATR